MSPWVMVTAYRASNCWISTRSSVLVGIYLAAFHDKTDVSGNGDVVQRVSRHRKGRQPPIDKGDKLVGVLAVRYCRGVGADRDLHTGLVGGQDRGARLEE